MISDPRVAGRTFLVTGATGFIGKDLVASLLRLGAKRVVAFSRHACNPKFTDRRVAELAGNVADPAAVGNAVEGIDVVFHLAAQKDVVRCESDPATAVKVNILGTMVVLAAAQHAGSVDQVVAASTVKAVHPTGVYGLSKAIMERLVCEARDGGPRAIAVRLAAIPGDGVVRQWRRSIEQAGEIQVTEPAMTRFVMSRMQAIEVLLRALTIRQPGILAPSCSAYRLGDLAESFAARYDARIRIVGPRPGESMHESLVGSEEAANAEMRDGGDILITPGHRRRGTAPVESQHALRLQGDALMALFDVPEPVDA